MVLFNSYSMYFFLSSLLPMYISFLIAAAWASVLFIIRVCRRKQLRETYRSELTRILQDMPAENGKILKSCCLFFNYDFCESLFFLNPWIMINFFMFNLDKEKPNSKTESINVSNEREIDDENFEKKDIQSFMQAIKNNWKLAILSFRMPMMLAVFSVSWLWIMLTTFDYYPWVLSWFLCFIWSFGAFILLFAPPTMESKVVLNATCKCYFYSILHKIMMNNKT
jgi:hypothetical protein